MTVVTNRKNKVVSVALIRGADPVYDIWDDGLESFPRFGDTFKPRLNAFIRIRRTRAGAWIETSTKTEDLL